MGSDGRTRPAGLEQVVATLFFAWELESEPVSLSLMTVTSIAEVFAERLVTLQLTSNNKSEESVIRVIFKACHGCYRGKEVYFSGIKALEILT